MLGKRGEALGEYPIDDMKVLVFTTLYPNNVWPNHGVFVKERMARVGSLRDYELRVVAPVPYFPPIKIGWRWLFSQVVREEVIDEVRVYHPRYFMTPKVGMALYGVMIFMSVLPIVKKIQREFDFDVIDAHYVYPDGFAAVLLGRFFRKRVVVSARGSDINLFAQFPLIRKLLQHTLRQADRVIAVSQALKEAMIRLEVPEEKIAVIPNGVDAEKFYPFPKVKARRKLDLPMDRNVILSVGSLVPVKGFDLLIQALKILVEDFCVTNLYMVIVGEGRLRSALQRQVSLLNLEDHVCLAGAVHHTELHIWYSAADLCCLVSRREGCPNVLMESLACGTPVVGTNVSGIREVIRSDRVGVLANRSAQEIAECIRDALRRGWNSDEIVQYASKHNWHEVANSVVRVFESAVTTHLYERGSEDLRRTRVRTVADEGRLRK